MNKYAFNLLLMVLLLLGNTVNAKDVIVGLIATERETRLKDILSNFGVQVILIDQDQSPSNNNIEEVIKEKNINRIFITDQLINKALIKVVTNNPAIRLMSTCSNLQNIINIQEINKKIPEQDIQMKIISGSHLAKIVSSFLIPDKNGWFSVYLHNCDSNRIINNPKNRKILESLGYKIAGFSNDGTIAAIEDKHNNIYLTDTFIISSDNNHLLAQQTLVAMSIIYSFLYS